MVASIESMSTIMNSKQNVSIYYFYQISMNKYFNGRDIHNLNDDLFPKNCK